MDQLIAAMSNQGSDIGKKLFAAVKDPQLGADAAPAADPEEKKRKELMLKYLQQLAQENQKKLKTGEIDEKEAQQMIKALKIFAEKIKDADMSIDDIETWCQNNRGAFTNLFNDNDKMAQIIQSIILAFKEANVKGGTAAQFGQWLSTQVSLFKAGGGGTVDVSAPKTAPKTEG